MFLKLHDIEDPEKKAFILETLHREFRDVAIEGSLGVGLGLIEEIMG
jgi:hypothetical protein